MWAAYRYYDIQSILGNYTRFSSAPSPTLQQKQRSIGTRSSLARSDPPYHRMLRAIVASAFSPIMISKLEPRIESITHDLINQVIDKGNMGLITDLAYPLPVIVIAELLGLPLEDRDIFRVWADKIASSTNNDDSNSTNTDNFLNLTGNDLCHGEIILLHGSSF